MDTDLTIPSLLLSAITYSKGYEPSQIKIHHKSIVSQEASNPTKRFKIKGRLKCWFYCPLLICVKFDMLVILWINWDSLYIHPYRLLWHSSDCCYQLTLFTRQDKGQALTNVVKYFIFKNPVPLSLVRGNEFNISSFYMKYVNWKYTWKGAK